MWVEVGEVGPRTQLKSFRDFFLITKHPAPKIGSNVAFCNVFRYSKILYLQWRWRLTFWYADFSFWNSNTNLLSQRDNMFVNPPDFNFPDEICPLVQGTFWIRLWFGPDHSGLTKADVYLATTVHSPSLQDLSPFITSLDIWKFQEPEVWSGKVKNHAFNVILFNS